MKTKSLFKLLATTSMLVITLALGNVTVFAEDTPPSIPDPFGGTDEDAPPSLELTGGDEAPPSLELNNTTKTPDTVNPGGGSPSGGSPGGGSGGSPILLKKKTTTPSANKTPAKVTDLDKDGDIDTADELLFQQQEEQGITETGPGLGYLLFVGGALALRNLKKLKRE